MQRSHQAPNPRYPPILELDMSRCWPLPVPLEVTANLGCQMLLMNGQVTLTVRKSPS